MPAAFSVSDDDIKYAEGILLPPGNVFDRERRAFIRNFDTLDLQAVPGSGKTTALLAKLLILDRYLPFEDGAGVLVVSHTNAAIDEIKGRIGSHCSNLFRYPNFVGTIQGFVDQFLAVPFYINKYRRQPLRIDDDIYDQKFSKPPFKIRDFTQQENNNARRYLMANVKKIRWSFDGGKLHLTDGYGGNLIDFKKPKGNTKPENYTDWSSSEKDRVLQWISRFKVQILSGGCMSYDDAYLLAKLSTFKNPSIKRLLQKRFSYVFVDEMQDMERHQHDLLEDIFFDEGASETAYQRIGDKNQSIFDGKDPAEHAFWIDRGTVLELNGSYRLSPVLASIVSNFAISPLKIEGRGQNPDGTSVSIKPHIIVYDDTTKGEVISKFSSVIKAHLDSGAIPVSFRNKYKAVAWATKTEAGKIRLGDYFPQYSREAKQQRPDYQNLESYIVNHPKDDKTFSSIERNISNALLRILREEEIVDVEGAAYSRTKMRDFLREVCPAYFLIFQENMYEWCIGVAGGGSALVVDKIRNSIPQFLLQFGTCVSASANFINGSFIPTQPASTSEKVDATTNVLRSNGVEVEISTVHRVKGETHAATLYMESFYERGGGGNYESERLAAALKGNAIASKPHNLVRQSAKMVYVGFSRPTHLLCFAVHENRFGKLEAEMPTGVWEVVRL